MMRQLKISVAITARGGEALERYLQEISREPMVTRISNHSALLNKSNTPDKRGNAVPAFPLF